VYLGAAFVAGRIEFAAHQDLAFVVRDDGDVVVLQPLGETWSDIVAQRTRAKRGA
jgi:hypothetical protein